MAKISEQDRFKFTLPIMKTRVKIVKDEDGNDVEERYISGVASDTDQDLTGDIMDISAIKTMADSLQKHIIEVNAEHDTSWRSELGEVVQLSVSKDNGLLFEGRLNDMSPAEDLWKALTKHQKQLGVSIGGYVKEYELAKNTNGELVRVFKDIELDHIAITSSPANPRTWVNAISKSLKSTDKTVRELNDISEKKDNYSEAEMSEKITMLLKSINKEDHTEDILNLIFKSDNMAKKISLEAEKAKKSVENVEPQASAIPEDESATETAVTEEVKTDVEESAEKVEEVEASEKSEEETTETDAKESTEEATTEEANVEGTLEEKSKKKKECKSGKKDMKEDEKEDTKDEEEDVNAEDVKDETDTEDVKDETNTEDAKDEGKGKKKGKGAKTKKNLNSASWAMDAAEYLAYAINYFDYADKDSSALKLALEQIKSVVATEVAEPEALESTEKSVSEVETDDAIKKTAENLTKNDDTEDLEVASALEEFAKTIEKKIEDKYSNEIAELKKSFDEKVAELSDMPADRKGVEIVKGLGEKQDGEDGSITKSTALQNAEKELEIIKKSNMHGDVKFAEIQSIKRKYKQEYNLDI